MNVCKFFILLSFMLCISGCLKKGNVEKEPNNSFSGANTIELARKISGYIDTKEDRDFYRLDIENDSIIH